MVAPPPVLLEQSPNAQWIWSALKAQLRHPWEAGSEQSRCRTWATWEHLVRRWSKIMKSHALSAICTVCKLHCCRLQVGEIQVLETNCLGHGETETTWWFSDSSTTTTSSSSSVQLPTGLAFGLNAVNQPANASDNGSSINHQSLIIFFLRRFDPVPWGPWLHCRWLWIAAGTGWCSSCWSGAGQLPSSPPGILEVDHGCNGELCRLKAWFPCCLHPNCRLELRVASAWFVSWFDSPLGVWDCFIFGTSHIGCWHGRHICSFCSPPFEHIWTGLCSVHLGGETHTLGSSNSLRYGPDASRPRGENPPLHVTWQLVYLGGVLSCFMA